MKIMKKKTSYIILAVIILLGIIVDIVTKVIFARVLGGGNDIVLIPNLLIFTYVENTGAAFGMLGGKTWFLIIVTIVFIVAFVLFDIYNHSNNPLYIWGVGLIISGAIGNFIDRIFLGYVRDFISIRFFSFVFNIADMWITFGIIIFAIYLFVSMIEEAKEKKGKVIKDETSDKQ